MHFFSKIDSSLRLPNDISLMENHPPYSMHFYLQGNTGTLFTQITTADSCLRYKYSMVTLPFCGLFWKISKHPAYCLPKFIEEVEVVI